MDWTLIVWLVALAALLVLDWRRKWSAVRIALVAMALLQLWFAQPNLTNAVRSAILSPPEQRVTTLGIDSLRVDDYRSGVWTLARTIGRQSEARAHHEAIAIGVLVWLAVSPIIPRRRAPASVGAERGVPATAA